MRDLAANQLGDGRSVSFTAATAAQITTTETRVGWIVVQALATNTKPLTIGASTVVHGTAAGTGRRGLTLNPGESTPNDFYINDISKIYVDVEVTGEGVQYFFGK